jgi:RNA polymerase sigma-70 factor (ECF subfamily)|tara:strand:+ start:208 stop:552 length:345 start_codon:yes stop_codon:yes gene_type:complete
MAYARTILRNLFIDHHRHLSKINEETYEDEIVSLHIGMQTLEQLMINRDQLDKIWAFLKPFETEVLYLWAVEGYSLEEVAKQLGIPKGTALARVHRLRSKLKTLLDDSQQGDTA